MTDTGRAVPDGLSQAEPVSRLGPTGFDPSRIMALSRQFGEREAAKVAERVDANELERNTIGCFEHLVRHGYKFIDIIVRKDGQETRFEGDWLARLFDPSREEWEAAIAMEARQGGDGETRLHPKDDSAGRQASPKEGQS